MEAVNVFIRRDALQNFDVINPGRQGQLNQNTVDGLIGIQVSISSSSSASLVVSGRS
jgi:hypothetical protein